jgi:TonB-linked SusC/RagA family outer membrane protein
VPGSVQVRVARIGYAPGTQTVAVVAGQPATLTFALQSQAVTLNSVVTVGYTNQERRDISGAVASVTDEALQDRKVATVEEALRGRIPGVQISSSGEPGEASRIVVRGQNFVSGSAEPLYVVDGLYLRQNPNLNPNDIASIQVLKDASAASQYGAQAANGVVVITTKRGSGAENRVSLRSYYGVQTTPKQIDMMNAQEWAALNAEAWKDDSRGIPLFTQQTLAGTRTIDTDWQDEVFKRGAIQDHNLQAMGGTGSANYLVSGGFLKQDGTVIGTGFERYSLRVNSELRRGRFTIGENLSLARANTKEPPTDQLIDALRFLPVIPVVDSTTNSRFGTGSDQAPTFGVNPVGAVALRQDNTRRNQAFGTVYGELALLQSLRYRLNLGLNYNDANYTRFQRAGYRPRQNEPRNPAELQDQRNNTQALLVENLLNFDQAFGRHQLNAVGGYTEQRESFSRIEGFRRNFPNESLEQLDAGTADLNNVGYANDSRLRSFLARANYTIADRYLFTASFRRDGSSRFGPNNRWGNFGAGSVGWVLSEEGFFKNSALGRGISFLKLRASYGTQGNQDFADYQFAGLIAGSGTSYPLGRDQAVQFGATQLNLANPNIRWQENTQQNYGLDFNLLGDRLAITADYYVGQSDGILVRAPLPSSLATVDAPFVNAGSVRNSGLELGATYRYERGGLQLNTSANLTTVRNKVLSLGNGAQPLFGGPGNVTRTAVGSSIGTFFVRKKVGIFQSQEEVNAYTFTNAAGVTTRIQPNARAGDVKYADVNNDGLINDDDRYEAGSGIPDFEGGFFLDGRYRRLDFTVGLRGMVGNEVFNDARWWTDRMDDNSGYRADLRPWTPQNPSTTTPRAVIGAPGNQNGIEQSDRWIEDGSFLRVQNIVVGYRLPQRITRVARMGSDSRVYVNLQNVFTITGYSGWDPETLGNNGGLLARGVDTGQIYPNPRTISVGIDLGF